LASIHKTVLLGDVTGVEPAIFARVSQPHIRSCSHVTLLDITSHNHASRLTANAGNPSQAMHVYGRIFIFTLLSGLFGDASGFEPAIFDALIQSMLLRHSAASEPKLMYQPIIFTPLSGLLVTWQIRTHNRP